MKEILLFVLSLIVCVCYSLPLDDNQTNKDTKSAFGPPFDEIVVESSLMVRKKTGARQAKNQNTTPQAVAATITLDNSKKVIKRQINHHKNRNQFPSFSGAAANAQAQSFNSAGPIGNFGAASTGALTQSFSADGKGLTGAAGFSGTQQYMFNGQTIDIAFGNSFSGANSNSANAGGAAITVTGPDGKKRPFQG